MTKSEIRKQLENDRAAFIANGGEITLCPSDKKRPYASRIGDNCTISYRGRKQITTKRYN